ncbi:MAG: hypothetical protein WD208_10905 [Dehalococcoidia bacterium]
MTRKTLVMMMGVLALAVLTTGSIALATQTDELEPGQYDRSRVKEDIVLQLLDDDGFVIDENQRVGAISADNPGGFGGYYFSEDDQTVFVYMTDPTQRAAAEAAVRAAHRRPLDGVSIETVQGRYTLRQLADWYKPLKAELNKHDVFPMMSSVRERDNRINFGYKDLESKRELIESVIVEFGVPLDAVHLEENYPIWSLGEPLRAE